MSEAVQHSESFTRTVPGRAEERERPEEIERIAEFKGRRALIVDDDDDLVTLVKSVLERAGMDVSTARDGVEALRRLYTRRPDIVILDLMLPELDGWEVLRRIRQLSDVPVIVLSALKDTSDVVRGFNLGADDYIGKPFLPSELVSRLRAVLRRSTPSETPTTKVVIPEVEFEMDFLDRRVFLKGNEINLSPREFELLGILVRNAGHPVPYRKIVDELWGEEDDLDRAKRRLKMTVFTIRRKMSQVPGGGDLIIVRPGFGYEFAMD